jgi:hypothetical protein
MAARQSHRVTFIRVTGYNSTIYKLLRCALLTAIADVAAARWLGVFVAGDRGESQIGGVGDVSDVSPLFAVNKRPAKLA